MGGIRLTTCSYFQYQPTMGTPVPITLYPPKKPLHFPVPPSVKALAPDASFFRSDDDTFNREYFAKLDRYGVDAIAGLLRQRARRPDDTLVLLCYEDLGKPGSACHRELFAMWWEKRTGFTVPEVGRYHVPRCLDIRRAKASLNGPLPVQEAMF